MNRQKAKIVTQVTIDEDRNVPDALPDMGEIITYRGQVEPDELKCIEGKGTLQGKLKYDILYGVDGEKRQAKCLAGLLPIHEMVYMEGVEEKDVLLVDWNIEDLTIEKIHSRKVRIRAVITFTITADGIYQENLVLSATADEPLETRKENIHITRIAVQKRETYRIGEDLTLSSNKPNISELIWKEIELRGTDCRPGDGGLTIRGELAVFALYKGEGEHIPLQWEEFSLPFSGEIPLSGSLEEMIPSIDTRLLHCDLSADEDEDGELRKFTVEALLELQIRLYESEDLTVVCDIYSPAKDVVLEESRTRLERIRMRNSSRCRVSERLRLSEGERILQICHGSCQIMLDEVNVTDEGLQIDGALKVTVLYASSDDAHPLCSLSGVLPFRHLLEARGMDSACTWRLKTDVESISVMMLGMDEAEVKASLALEALILSGEERSVLTDAGLVPYNEEKIRKMPGIVGYRVQQGDTLWKIAKKFYTTVDGIRSSNEIGEDVVPGQRLILVKQAEELDV